jgi:hypothetical protein
MCSRRGQFGLRGSLPAHVRPGRHIPIKRRFRASCPGPPCSRAGRGRPTAEGPPTGGRDLSPARRLEWPALMTNRPTQRPAPGSPRKSPDRAGASVAIRGPTRRLGGGSGDYDARFRRSRQFEGGPVAGSGGSGRFARYAQANLNPPTRSRRVISPPRARAPPQFAHVRTAGLGYSDLQMRGP